MSLDPDVSAAFEESAGHYPAHAIDLGGDELDGDPAEIEDALAAIELEILAEESTREQLRAFTAAAMERVWPLIERGMLGRGLAQERLELIARAHENFGLSKKEIDHVVDQILKGSNPCERPRRVNGDANGHHAETLCDACPEEPTRKLLAPTPFVLRDPSELKKRPWLYGNHFMRGQVSATLGRTKTGKTALVTAEILAMTSGRGLLGKVVDRPLRVWFIGEDNRRELELRFNAACIHYDITPDLIEGRLFVDSRLDFESLRIAQQTGKGVVVNEELLARLKKQIADKRIDVMVLDPLIKFHGVPENDNASMDMVILALTEVTNELNVATDLLHHLRKQAQGSSGPFTVDDSRGGSAVVSAVRTARVINPMSRDEAGRTGVPEGDRKRYFSVTSESNMAPPEQAEWYRTVSVLVPCEDGNEPVGVVERWKFPDPLADVASVDVSAIRHLAQGGAYRESSQADAWFGNAVAEHLKLDVRNNPADKAKVKAMIKTLLRDKVLDIEEREDPVQRKKFKYIVPGPVSLDRIVATDQEDDIAQL